MKNLLFFTLLILALSCGRNTDSKNLSAPENPKTSESSLSDVPDDIFTPNTNYTPGESLIIERQFQESKIDGYMLHLPNSFSEKTSRIPILVFLQGSGATGGEISKVNLYGIPSYLKKPEVLNEKSASYLKDSFIVVAPHVSIGAHEDEEIAIKQLVDEMVDVYYGDSSRVYLTGLSFGAYSTWGLSSRIPGEFAAVAPLAGGVWSVKGYDKMKDLPIWVGHCTGDPDLKYEPVAAAVDTLELVSGRKFLRLDGADIASDDGFKSDRVFSTFQKNQHDAWTEIYDNPDFYRWLLTKSL